jgi:hypothetical protein
VGEARGAGSTAGQPILPRKSLCKLLFSVNDFPVCVSCFKNVRNKNYSREASEGKMRT